MPLENPNGAYAGLDATSPAQTEDGLELGNHMRMVKDTIKRQWPGAAGGGLSRPMDVGETEIEALQGVTGNIQQQLNTAINQRIPTVPTATVGNIAVFDINGTISDSGIPLSALQALIDAAS